VWARAHHAATRCGSGTDRTRPSQSLISENTPKDLMRLLTARRAQTWL
jgi:hypothetical protein